MESAARRQSPSERQKTPTKAIASRVLTGNVCRNDFDVGIGFRVFVLANYQNSSFGGSRNSLAREPVWLFVWFNQCLLVRDGTLTGTDPVKSLCIMQQRYARLFEQ